MDKPKQDKNFRRDFAKEISKPMKKQEKEKKIRSAATAKAQKDMEAGGSSTSVRASKIGRTLETKMKNPKKEKEHAEELECNSDDDQDYIDFLRTYDDGVDQVWRL